jgi:oligoribonuclease
MVEDTRLVWVDLETTGLEPSQHHILEVAMVITGPDLVPIAELTKVVWQPDSILQSIEPFVTNMHTKTGLLDRVRQSGESLQDVQQAALTLVTKHCRHQQGKLAGNSIHFDRKFLKHHMPVLEGVFHECMLDVSSLHLLARAWYGQSMKFLKVNAHQAQSDIHESMGELGFYLGRMFRPKS